jgi:hypothetical protein
MISIRRKRESCCGREGCRRGVKEEKEKKEEGRRKRNLTIEVYLNRISWLLRITVHSYFLIQYLLL